MRNVGQTQFSAIIGIEPAAAGRLVSDFMALNRRAGNSRESGRYTRRELSLAWHDLVVGVRAEAESAPRGAGIRAL
jgi:hypothetical protein